MKIKGWYHSKTHKPKAERGVTTVTANLLHRKTSMKDDRSTVLAP